MPKSALSPYVTCFKGQNEIDSPTFVEIFQKYDQDGNGFIESHELDNFLRDLQQENPKNNKSDFEKFKRSILDNYDHDHDGRIGMAELSKILPTEDNFLLHFRQSTKLHVADFMKIWYHYDVDRSGFLEREELKGFLFDLLKKTSDKEKDHLQKLDDYTEVILELFDVNKDNKIELCELSKILPVEENYLSKFQADAELTKDEFNDLFRHYDQDNNGHIEDSELMGFIRDVLARTGKEPTTTALEKYRQNILSVCDSDNDGRLSSKELAMLLCSSEK